MSCGLDAGAGSVDWAAVLLQNRYNFVVIYSDASFQHVLQRLLHSYIKLHTHTYMHTQAQIDTILQAHVLHRFVRYAIVIAPRRVEFGSALLCSVLFLLVRFSVQFNFFYIFQFQVRCLSLLACSYCFFILRLEEGLEQLRLIDFF